MSAGELILRPATEIDRAFALDLVPRLRGFGPSTLRSAEDLDGAERRGVLIIPHPRGLPPPQPLYIEVVPPASSSGDDPEGPVLLGSHG